MKKQGLKLTAGLIAVGTLISTAAALATEIDINRDGYARYTMKLDGTNFYKGGDLDCDLTELLIGWTCDDTYLNAKGVDLTIVGSGRKLEAYASKMPGAYFPAKECKIEYMNTKERGKLKLRVTGDEGCTITVIEHRDGGKQDPIINIFTLEDSEC
ncbi:MAG: hypothetical protein AB7P04_11025 [Bacteriovoracia bacterium]